MVRQLPELKADIIERLVHEAGEMRARARAPHSGFAVGAAVLSGDGTIVGGCNVESTSYPLSCCAERVALYRAIASGHQQFQALAVVTANGASPCGACRQVIWDLCGAIPVYIADTAGKRRITSSQDLLPEAFDEGDLP